MQKKAPLLLMILDGWGVRSSAEGNAIFQAETPNYDTLWAQYPTTVLQASGEAVGLPEGQMGNSEVGHLNIGAGRVVYQEFTRITKAIREGAFFNNDVFLDAISSAKKGKRSLHLMGLLSDGGVHSHLDHLLALITLAAREELEDVCVHAFLDGRDVPPASALQYVRQLEDVMGEAGCGKIATIMGRYYAMDRDKRWDRTERAYTAMTVGAGLHVNSAEDAVHQSYARNETDEFVQPTVIVGEDGKPTGTVEPGDVIIFFNFRADRARQITRAYVTRDFDAFVRPTGYLDPHFVCMTQYDKEIQAPVAFPPQSLVNTLGEVLARNHLRQLRIAETEKYAHVTFFFNGGVETPNPGEDRVLIPSPKVATYDLKPEMSASELTVKVSGVIASGKHDVIIMNFANPDMIGHTGKMEAAVKAVETVDACMGNIVASVLEKGGTVLITADHGNAEVMVENDGGPHTAHTVDRVPFILVDERLRNISLRDGGALKDIAPTILELLGLPEPAEMTGRSLISSN